MPVKVAVMPDAQAGRCCGVFRLCRWSCERRFLWDRRGCLRLRLCLIEAALEEKGLGLSGASYLYSTGGRDGGCCADAGGRLCGAHKAYAEALVERPKSGFPLYGMARSSEAAGDAAKARAEYAEFAEAWKHGDAGMPEMAHAREYSERAEGCGEGW